MNRTDFGLATPRRPARLALAYHEKKRALGLRIAAGASLCALDQDHYWPYHDKAFDSVLAGDTSQLYRDGRLAIATDQNLDVTTFMTCLDQDQ